MTSAFLRPDDPALREVLTDATVSILAVGGVTTWSVRALSRWMRLAPATLSTHHTRAQLLEMICACFTGRWIEWSGSGAWWSRPVELPLRLPETQDERHGVRVLQALKELALCEWQRGDPLALDQLDRIAQVELTLVRERLGPEATADSRAVVALVHGLRTQLAEPRPSIDPERARELVLSMVRTDGAWTHSA